MTMATITKENISLGWLTYSSEVQSIIIMAEHGDVQADMVLEKEFLHADMQTAGSRLSITLGET